MLESTADAIFEEVGLDKDSFPNLYRETVFILNYKMASISHLGLTQERVDLFSEQKRAIVNDLREFQEKGTLEEAEENNAK